MKTAVFGSWHLASVYAVGLATLGHDVRLIASPEVVFGYEKGNPPVFEPGLDEGIVRFSKEQKLFFTSVAADPQNRAEVCFFAEDCKVTEKGVDLVHFRSLFDPIARSGLFRIIVISSQLPLGTCRMLQEEYPDVRIVYFPEFLRLGNALKIFLEPDYMVMGGEKEDTSRVLEFFDAVSVSKFEVRLEEAEMAKHAANTFVATTVSFISELTKFSEKFNVDLTKVGEIMRHDKRIGPKAYTMPGMGFSGETVERDIRVLLRLGEGLGVSLPLLQQVIAVNNQHNLFIEQKLNELFPRFENVKIGFLGATYKPFTSTLRGSLVAVLMDALVKKGAKIALFDPHVEGSPFLVESPAEVFENSDAVVITVSKKEFREIPYKEMAGILRRKIIIDAANLLDKEFVRDLHLDSYYSIGRGSLL